MLKIVFASATVALVNAAGSVELNEKNFDAETTGASSNRPLSRSRRPGCRRAERAKKSGRPACRCRRPWASGRRGCEGRRRERDQGWARTAGKRAEPSGETSPAKLPQLQLSCCSRSRSGRDSDKRDIGNIGKICIRHEFIAEPSHVGARQITSRSPHHTHTQNWLVALCCCVMLPVYSSMKRLSGTCLIAAVCQ